MVNIKTNLANKRNYGSVRSLSDIKYIVIHYTSNDGDSDEANGKYFHNNVVSASAHYFVDDDSITQSVPDNYVAWSVGGKRYADAAKTGGGKLHGKCTNHNSISIELCDDVKNGVVYPSAATIQNALELTEYLMKIYNIPKDNVIRHFDVTGKYCPKYWMDDAKWKAEFWNKLNAEKFKPYLARITATALNVRRGPGTEYPVSTMVKKNQVYTIVDEKGNWGKLKSGAGWVSLKYTTKL